MTNTSKEARAERLRRMRAKAHPDLGVRETARRHGWKEDTYKAHENGERGITPARAAKYAAAFRIPKATAGWLLSGDGEQPDLSPPSTAGVYQGFSDSADDKASEQPQARPEGSRMDQDIYREIGRVEGKLEGKLEAFQKKVLERLDAIEGRSQRNPHRARK